MKTPVITRIELTPVFVPFNPEVQSLMRHFIADYDAVVESRKRALPFMLDAHRKVWSTDVGMNRFIGRTRA